MLLAGSLLGANPAQAAASAEEARAAVRGVLEAGDYQGELPLPQPGSADGAGGDNGVWKNPDWWRDEGDAQAPDRYHAAPESGKPSGFSLDLPPAVLEVLRVLMWGVILAGGALLGYYLVNEAVLHFRGRKSNWEEADEGETGAAGQRRARGISLEDCDRLAAEGDFAGAIHALLLHWLGRLREGGAALPAALTSREILRRLRLAKEEQDALAVLVRLVELTHFGGRGASEDDFRQCRNLYRQVATGGAA